MIRVKPEESEESRRILIFVQYSQALFSFADYQLPIHFEQFYF